MILKYGKDQEKICNTNCKVINLLLHIKQVCMQLPTSFVPGNMEIDCLDVAEETTGVLQFLNSNLTGYANTVLSTPKAIYIPIKTHKNEDGTVEYIPLFDSCKSNFLVRLKSSKKGLDIPMRKKAPTDKKKKPTIATQQIPLAQNQHQEQQPTTLQQESPPHDSYKAKGLSVIKANTSTISQHTFSPPSTPASTTPLINSTSKKRLKKGELGIVL